MSGVLAIIPARGGSKRLPGKNLRPLAGKPLLAHTLDQAAAARLVDEVVVSTDSLEIAALARVGGAGVVDRPAAISGDMASSEAALRHVLAVRAEAGKAAPDLIVFLQCTALLRRPDDIDRAIETLRAQRADSLLSVVPAVDFLWRLDEGGRPYAFNYDYRARPRSQDRPVEYRENGSIYVLRPWLLTETDNRLGGKIALYVMADWQGLDIDNALDFRRCEWLFQTYRAELTTPRDTG